MSQVYNPTMVANLATHFARRGEPAGSLAALVPSALDFLNLRGLWMAGSVDENDNYMDLSGQGRTMYSVSGTVNAMYSLVSYTTFNSAVPVYLRRQSETGIEITGDLTVMGWFYFSNAATAEGLISKWLAAGNERAFRLHKTAADAIQFDVSADGAATTSVTSTGTVTTGLWYFVAGRFKANTELAVWISPNMPGDYDTNLVAPAAINNSADDLSIGLTDAGSYLTGAWLMAAVCAGALTDTAVWSIYQQTRGMVR